LEIIGDGELRDDIERQIEALGLSSLVTLRGALYGQELEKRYDHSDIFVLPTLFESFGLVYIEAMAKALPIVSTNVEAVRNVVVNNRNGLLTELNPESFCSAIYELASNNSLYETISAQNLEDVAIYNWDSVLTKMLGVYGGLV
jgi:glycosyltransferase involved in cell wall biosynthesis